MDWQQLSALAIVAVTAGLLAWHRLRPRRGPRRGKPCAGCGATSLPPRETIIFHARKGQRPEVHIRVSGSTAPATASTNPS